MRVHYFFTMIFFIINKLELYLQKNICNHGIL